MDNEKKRPILKWIMRGVLVWAIIGVALSIESGFAELAQQTNDTLVLMNSGRHAEVGANPIHVGSILMNVPGKMFGLVPNFLGWLLDDVILTQGMLVLLLIILAIAVIVLLVIVFRKKSEPTL